MNVVVINDFGSVNGGGSKVALGSAGGLANAGHRVFLFTAVAPTAQDLAQLPGVEQISTGQHEIINDPNRTRAVIQGFWNFSARRRMDQLLLTLDKSDTVVHVHLWAKALSSSVVQAALSKGFMVVLTMHDFLTVCPNGTFFNHRSQQICKLTPMSSACILSNCDARSYLHKLWRVGRQAVQKVAGHLPDGIRDFISISDLSEKVLAPALQSGARIHRVNNYTDAVQIEPVNLARNRTFMFSGRLVPEKGTLLFAECVQRLQLDNAFIGSGDLRSKLESQFPEAKITGWLAPEEATSRLRSARALVFPSLWYEGQGLVVAEASAMGIPSIVSDACAAREWVVDGVTGLWFRNGDIDDLCKKVRLLRDDVEAAETMGREAYRLYWQRPATLEKHIRDLESVYELMLGKPAVERHLVSIAGYSANG